MYWANSVVRETPHTMMLLPPNFIVFFVYLGFKAALGGLLTYRFPSVPKRLTFLSSLQNTFRHVALSRFLDAKARRSFMFFLDRSGTFLGVQLGKEASSNRPLMLRSLMGAFRAFFRSRELANGLTFDFLMSNRSKFCVFFRFLPLVSLLGSYFKA